MSVGGTTTILYTDICRSSELLAAVGAEAYAAIFSAHVALVRSEVEARGGRLSKLLGDGVLALFDSVHAGVTAAVAVQQAVDRANRRGNGPVLDVREGLAVGDVVASDDELFGGALVVARRLCDSAEAGEILVSDLVRLLIEGRDDIVLEQAGERGNALEFPNLAVDEDLHMTIFSHQTLFVHGWTLMNTDLPSEETIGVYLCLSVDENFRLRLIASGTPAFPANRGRRDGGIRLVRLRRWLGREGRRGPRKKLETGDLLWRCR